MGERGTSQRFEHICLEAGIEKHERRILSILLINMRGAYHYHGLTIIYCSPVQGISCQTELFKARQHCRYVARSSQTWLKEMLFFVCLFVTLERNVVCLFVTLEMNVVCLFVCLSPLKEMLLDSSTSKRSSEASPNWPRSNGHVGHKIKGILRTLGDSLRIT